MLRNKKLGQNYRCEKLSKHHLRHIQTKRLKKKTENRWRYSENWDAGQPKKVWGQKQRLGSLSRHLVGPFQCAPDWEGRPKIMVAMLAKFGRPNFHENKKENWGPNHYFDNVIKKHRSAHWISSTLRGKTKNQGVDSQKIVTIEINLGSKPPISRFVKTACWSHSIGSRLRGGTANRGQNLGSKPPIWKIMRFEVWCKLHASEMVAQIGNLEMVSQGGDSEIVAGTRSLPVSHNPSTALPKYPTSVPILGFNNLKFPQLEVSTTWSPCNRWQGLFLWKAHLVFWWVRLETNH